MENEIRYYLAQIKALMAEPEEGDPRVPFKPQYMVAAVRRPTGAIELVMNTMHIAEKIDDILSSYDEEMRFKANPSIRMENIMIV